MGRICLAGSVRVEGGGGVVGGEGLGRPGRLMLAYLVFHRSRPVGRDELAEVCWGDGLPQSWEQLVRGSVARIRAAFAGVGWPAQEVLVRGFGGYQLRLPAGTVVDVEAAAAHVATAGEALEAGEAEVAAKEAALALEVATGGFLPGVGGSWVEARAAELGELRLRALEVVSDAALALGDWDGAARAAEAVLAVEPFRESAHVALMAALAGRGERAEALRAYERCRAVLAEELGVHPGPRAQAVYSGLLTEQEDGGLSLAGPVVPLPVPSVLVQVAAAGSFVGREAELGVLRGALDRAGVDGRQVVLVEGEPGIGKTRLVAEFACAAQAAGARVLYGRADEDLGVPYAPVVEALGGYVAEAPVAELAGHVARHGGELARVVPGLAVRLPDAVPASKAEGDRHLVLAAAADLLAVAARAVPVVLIVDDLQWAAAPGLALLRHLVRSSGSKPVVVVAAHRAPEAGSPLSDFLAQLRREPGVARLRLGGLGEADVAAYLAAEAEGVDDDVGGASAGRVHAETGGNPFFVAEMVRHLGEGRGGPPAGVVEVVRARLARRSPECQRVLSVAAVVGSAFSFDVLARLAETGPDALLDGLEEAVRAALVVEEDQPGRYQFVHAIVRDALYDQLSATRRARVHREVGKALVAAGNPQTTERAAALAHHFCAAAPIGGGTEGATHALAAARLAMVQYAWEDAAAHAERGLQAQTWDTQPDLQLRYDLQMALAHAHTGTPTTYHDGYVLAGLAAAETARRLGSPERMGLAACACFRLTWVDCEDTRAARAVAVEALAALGDDAPAVRARLLSILGESALGVVSETGSRQALQLARSCGDPAVLAHVLLRCWSVLSGSEKAEEQLALAEELISLREHETPGFQPLVSGLRMRADARLMLGDRDGYEADRAAFEEASRRIASPRIEGQVHVHRILMALLDGRFADAVRLKEMVPAKFSPASAAAWKEEALPRIWCRRGAYTVGVTIHPVYWAHIAREQGGMMEALPLVLSALESLPREDRTVRALAARSQLDLGDAEAARRELAALEEVGLDDLPDRSFTLACLAEVAAGLPDPAWAARLMPLLRPHGGQLVVARLTSLCPGAADRYLGQLATVLGEWEEAERRFYAAASLEERINAPPLLARTRWCHALMLHKRNGEPDRAAARRLLVSVLDTTDRLGMAPLHDEARKLLGSLRR